MQKLRISLIAGKIECLTMCLESSLSNNPLKQIFCGMVKPCFGVHCTVNFGNRLNIIFEQDSKQDQKNRTVSDLSGNR